MQNAPPQINSQNQSNFQEAALNGPQGQIQTELQINYLGSIIPPEQIKIHPNLISDYEQLAKNKVDPYYEKVLLTGNGASLRKSLMLDEPPKFFNPFVVNYGNNNLCFNPFYTNDPNKISLNLNGYLFRRFKKINLDEDLKYFSYAEKRIFNFNQIVRFLLYLSIPVNFLFYYRLRDRKFLLLTFLNFLFLPYTNYILRFIFYNSYIRNFNGYSDEQVDFIMTCNQSKIQQLPTHPGGATLATAESHQANSGNKADI